ncbi:DUF5994 family protein [Streptosporangium sp. NPDC023615]|uniref:DUF5994 family protein n=1 Tax=Streptosporangium sp. NPDC023615 TaxID=3154794 RepID=UPI003434BDF8
MAPKRSPLHTLLNAVAGMDHGAAPEISASAASGSTASAASPARVSLDPTLGRRGAVDGGWWPRSRDAAAELPGLIADIDHRLNRPVLRVGLPLESWDDIPHRVAAPGRQVKVGWFRHMDAHTVTLIGANTEPVTLRVIPPDTEDGAATDALTAAASGASGASGA